MAKDLERNPLFREFVLLKKAWAYRGKGCELVYYYDDYPQLDGIVRILQNYGLIQEITMGNVQRFAIAEDLAEYLRMHSA